MDQNRNIIFIDIIVVKDRPCRAARYPGKLIVTLQADFLSELRVVGKGIREYLKM